MKKVRRLFVLWVACLLLCIATAAAAQTDLEKFMQDFEPEYQISGATFYGGIDTASPYAKPLRQLITTDDGAVILLDKVLVTEDKLSVSVLIGLDPNGGDWVAPDAVYLDLPVIEVEPRLPYPPDYFEAPFGGGGGGPGYDFEVVHEHPLVVAGLISTELLYFDGYVAAEDPIQATVKILGYKTCWDIGGDSYPDERCFQERGPWEFKFETDGKELAEKTKEFALNETIDIAGRTLRLDRLRFNPMHLILMTSRFESDPESYGGNLTAFAATDDGLEFYLDINHFPYFGFSQLILEPERIQALEKTKTLKLSFCLSTPELLLNSQYDAYLNKANYNCDPAWSTVIDLK